MEYVIVKTRDGYDVRERYTWQYWGSRKTLEEIEAWIDSHTKRERR